MCLRMPCGSQTCNCKKCSDWLKRWVEAQHNILSCKVFHDLLIIKQGNILEGPVSVTPKGSIGKRTSDSFLFNLPFCDHFIS